MTGVHKPLQWTQTDAIVEALSAESCHIVLETSPPDYVEKISRYLESSVGHGGQDAGPNDPAEEESDSGDSLFITQKPVPEAVRSQRRCRYNLKSDSSPARDLEESGDDTSSPDSHEESRAAKRRQAKRIRPPKFSFPFLTDRKSKPRSTQLSARQSAALHNNAMGGFLRCVRELWQSYQRGDDVQSSLPTVDMDGENISPLSEEEESSESEDIKVVERKCFVAPSKSKCSQPWYTPGKRDFEVKRQRSSQRARQEGTSQRKKLHKIPAKRSTSRVTAPSSDTESSDNGDPSHRVLMERETSDKHMTCDRSIAAHTKTPTTKTRLTGGNKEILPQEKESEEELCGDSDATMCEALERGSPREYTLNGREPCPNVTEPPADVFHTDGLSETRQEEDEPESQSLLESLPDLISDTNNDKTRVKNKKKAKGDDDSVEGGRGQSHEEPEGLHAAASVDVEEEETPSPSEDHPAEPPAPQTSDETQLSEENPSHDDIIPRQEERLSPGSKQMKKKKRKKKKAADNIREEEDGNLKSDVRSENDSLFSVTCNMVNDGKEEKKKKRERSVEDDESVEQLIRLNEDAETGRKKKKRKKEKLTVNMEEDEEEEALTSDRPLSSERQLEEKENSDAPRETLEKKRKRQKKKQLLTSHEEAEVGADGGTDLSSNNDVTLEGSTGQSVKKKKKKKKRRESICEGEDISSTPDKNKKLNNAGNCQKTDEGPDDKDTELGSKKKNEMISRNVSEDAVTQSDDSVSVRKKEKKRTSSFLAADAEEKEAQTHEEQTSVAAHVWGAERPGVSAGEFQTESAEIAGNLETSNDGVRKKKRKRKMSMVQENVEEGHRQDVKEPNETCESALPENTNTGVKRKKKRRRNESESVTPMERLDSAAEAGCPAADEATVLKKKKKEKTQESPPAATDDAESEEATLKNCSSVSHKRKCKHSTSALVTKEIDDDSAEMSHDGGTSDKTSKETLNMAEPASPSSETPGNPELNHVREKKKKKKVKSTDNVLLERKLSTESVEIETHKSKKKERNKTSVPSFMSSSPVLSQSEVSSSDCSRKNKPKKAKRRLHNPSEDFFSDY